MGGRIILGVAAIVLAAGAGCSDRQSSASGTITGVLGEEGGIPTAQTGLRPFGSGSVWVTSSSYSTHVMVTNDGHYTVYVPPGRYSLRGVPAPSRTCLDPNTVTVTAGATVRADVICLIA